jgi:hypothetical protein
LSAGLVDGLRLVVSPTVTGSATGGVAPVAEYGGVGAFVQGSDQLATPCHRRILHP